MSEVLFENVDCLHMHVPSIEEGLAFYRDALGLKLLWRTQTACGLGMSNDITEIVLGTDDNTMTDLNVADTRKAVEEFVAAGGQLEEGPFDVPVGQCAVVIDPWGNRYCLLDTSKGTYDTVADGTVEGVSKK